MKTYELVASDYLTGFERDINQLAAQGYEMANINDIYIDTRRVATKFIAIMVKDEDSCGSI